MNASGSQACGPGLAAELRSQAHSLGFAQVGFVSADPLTPARSRFLAWIAEGYQGDMHYLARDAALRAEPRHLLSTAKTAIVCMANYGSLPADRASRPAAPGAGPWAIDEPTGRIARYALGRDYHRVFGDRLRSLAAWLSAQTGEEVAYRDCVDSTPLLERAFAEAADLGFIGKNTLLITPGMGSYTLLGTLLVSVEIRDARTLPLLPSQVSGCGRCTACKDICPTGALVGDRLLDARRCISYLTIELDGPIPVELRPLIGDWIFGCDLCQEACPFNVTAPQTAGISDLEPTRLLHRMPLRSLLSLSKRDHKKLVKGTALRRVRRRQLLRNVAVALGNVGTPDDIAPLFACASDRKEEPLVRGHAVWAAHRLGAPADTFHALAQAETDPFVLAELGRIGDGDLGTVLKSSLRPHV